MLYAGIDVGAQSVKAVIFDGREVVARKLVVTEEEAGRAAHMVYHGLLQEAGLEPSDVARVLATGWGAGNVAFAHGKSSEQVCAARGARWLRPTARTVLDMGAEGARAMKLDPEGSLEDFSNNVKCASGTGAFIELGAIYLKVPLEEMGLLSLAADGMAEVSNTCAVFAESVIISHIHKGESRERIAAGVHHAAATRAVELLNRIGLVQDVVMIGGTALNAGLVKALQDMAGVPFLVPEHPACVTALGAALQAHAHKQPRRRRGTGGRGEE